MVAISYTAAMLCLQMNTMTIPFGLIGRCFSGFPGNEEAVKSALISAACVAVGSLRDFLTKVLDYAEARLRADSSDFLRGNIKSFKCSKDSSLRREYIIVASHSNWLYSCWDNGSGTVFS